jgi:hypothetical protein
MYCEKMRVLWTHDQRDLMGPADSTNVGPREVTAG